MDVVNELPSLGTVRLITGPGAGNSYKITRPITTIGREPGNDIIISDPSVSRQHAQIIYNAGNWSIKKLSAQNILTINQREVQQSPLSDRDTVGIGPGSSFLFYIEPGGAQQGVPSTERSAGPPQGRPADAHVVATPQAAPGMGTPNPLGPVNYPVPANQPQQHMNFNMPQPSLQQGGQPFGAQVSTPMPVQPGPKEFATQRSDFAGSLPAGTVAAGTINEPIQGIPSLEISTNTDYKKEVYPLYPGQQIFDIGRDPSNSIVINRPTVSSFHVQLVREGNQLVLVHPHPKRGKTLNGLTYQGRSIGGEEPFRKVLTRGDVFRISDQNGTFVSLAYNDGSGQVQEILPELRPIPLGAPLLTLGRAPDNTVVLSHPQVSSYHARLEQIQGGYRIVDNDSTNHVYVNAHRVTHATLKPGDQIRIGPFALTYTGTQLTQHDESNGIRIDALHLRKEGNNHTVLINDISIAIPPRKFVALVGGSGAGKSTLMDALNGLRPAQGGAVLYNGQDYYKHLAAFSTQLGYVPQDDIIHRDLTVGRALYYAAKLRLPKDFTEHQIRERIDEVLDDVEMKHRRNLLVSRLSGGQRKRVSIALELLANPSVFFLDEPTSGLDPGLDRKMMLLLRKLADKGHTIVLVTHATNNINACDYICFLAQGGRLAYFGPPNDAKVYFGKTDFAEIYSALEPTEEHPNAPVEAEERFKGSPDYLRNVVESLNQGPAGRANVIQQAEAVKPPKRGNPWKQFFLLSMRYLELLLNDKVNLAILILQAPVIGLILFLLTASGTFSPNSIVTCAGPDPNQPSRIAVVSCQSVVTMLSGPQGDAYAQQQGKTKAALFNQSIEWGSGGNAQKTLFIMAFAAVMFGCINGAREIVKEAAIYKRERSVNLGIAPYLFSKIAVLGAFSLVQSFILVFMVNIKSPFDQLHGIIIGSTFLEIYVSLALTSIAGLMTGLLVSAIVPNNDRAMSLIPLPLIPQVIFAGVIFSLNDPPLLQIPGAFFAARWSMAAMGSTIGLHADKSAVDSFSYAGTLFPGLDANGNLLTNQPWATTHLLLCWGVLVVMIVAQGLAIAWFLKRKDVRA
ncbi:FHA domain-containing protein [Tengunoibacter tsumagoiensis]|uniref:ABC transporter ATP-binding protein n=1 Tax=Tengunoibacter tsumagoiensis TaxID=2014871 RepID=A0A401ZUL0_9CHLR|nr:FHA domain-containing protein [Tengunoibacter tsumagoiensis]GCE10414.1 ABC transporter ATP-binding protein [Tengunoibacter tsumagoiensis]